MDPRKETHHTTEESRRGHANLATLKQRRIVAAYEESHKRKPGTSTHENTRRLGIQHRRSGVAKMAGRPQRIIIRLSRRRRGAHHKRNLIDGPPW